MRGFDTWMLENKTMMQREKKCICYALEHDYNKSLFQRVLYVICPKSKYNSLDVVNGIALEYILRFSLIQ